MQQEFKLPGLHVCLGLRIAGLQNTDAAGFSHNGKFREHSHLGQFPAAADYLDVFLRGRDWPAQQRDGQ
ncbi:MAG TPA: hypothetical protein VN281_04490 [Verrucomicrobiae bacterium]|nr:hypothetical protein [Verrucomicrobiae bacterium]